MHDLNWPVPHFSAQRMKTLADEASIVRAGPFVALLTTAGVLASRGSFPLARKLLRVISEEQPGNSVPFPYFTRIVAAALIAHDAELAARLVAEHFSAKYQVKFSSETSRLPLQCIRLSVRNDTAMFEFSSDMFASDPDITLARWATVLQLVDVYMTSMFRIDGDVTINTGDGGMSPGLAFSDYRSGYFLVPDSHYLDSDRYASIRQELEDFPVAWEERRPMAFWRGSTTGQPKDPALGWRSMPRIRLSEISREFPDLIDAGVTGIHGNIDEAGRRDIAARALTRTSVKRSEFQKYKYQVDIDGNSAAWDALFMKLLTGSPVLKVQSVLGWTQWYYDRLKPWENYVPVSVDMGDLIDKIRWLRDNDDKAQAIGANGRALALSLTDQKEVRAIAPVIAAAIRGDRDGPIVDLRFGRGRPDNAVLGDGWEEAESDAVRMAEQQARLRLTAPYVPGDHVLLVDVSVDGGDRQVVEITNETGVVLRQSIVGRSTVRGLLPRASHSAVVSLNITFSAEERQASPFEKTTAPRIAVHRVGIAIARSVARGGYASAADLIAATNAHRSGGRKHEILRSAEGFRPVALPGGRTGLPIVTTFGTRVYWDEVVGEVRHGRSGAVPENLVLAEHGDFGVLCHRSLDRKQDRIVIRPEGSLASTDAWIPWTGGYIHTFELLRRQTAAGMRFGLRGGCLYLCAEPDGSITLSRPHWNAWETFGFQA